MSQNKVGNLPNVQKKQEKPQSIQSNTQLEKNKQVVKKPSQQIKNISDSQIESNVSIIDKKENQIPSLKQEVKNHKQNQPTKQKKKQGVNQIPNASPLQSTKTVQQGNKSLDQSNKKVQVSKVDPVNKLPQNTKPQTKAQSKQVKNTNANDPKDPKKDANPIKQQEKNQQNQKKTEQKQKAIEKTEQKKQQIPNAQVKSQTKVEINSSDTTKINETKTSKPQQTSTTNKKQQSVDSKVQKNKETKPESNKEQHFPQPSQQNKPFKVQQKKIDNIQKAVNINQAQIKPSKENSDKKTFDQPQKNIKTTSQTLIPKQQEKKVADDIKKIDKQKQKEKKPTSEKHQDLKQKTTEAQNKGSQIAQEKQQPNLKKQNNQNKIQQNSQIHHSISGLIQQLVGKLKPKNIDVQKQKRTTNDKVDLVLSLQPKIKPSSSQHPGRVKFQIKINPQTQSQTAKSITPKISSSSKPKQQIDKPPQSKQSHNLANEQQTQSKGDKYKIEQNKQQSSNQQNRTQKQKQSKETVPFRLNFILYDLKNQNQKNGNPQKTKPLFEQINEKMSSLQEKVKDLLQIKIRQLGQNQQTIQEIQPENMKLQKNVASSKKSNKILVSLKFNTEKITNLFKIDKKLILQLDGILKNIIQSTSKNENKEKSTLQNQQEDNDKKKQQQVQLQEQSPVKSQPLKKDSQSNNKTQFLPVYNTFTQLLIHTELKDMEQMKFLDLLFQGFTLRHFSSTSNPNKHNVTANTKQPLSSMVSSILPQQVIAYLQNISHGQASIKFKSIENLHKLLNQIGIKQLFDETPTIKQLLKQIFYTNLKSLVKNKESKQNPLKNQKTKQLQDNQDQFKNIWSVFDTILSLASTHGLSLELVLYQKLSFKITVQNPSSDIRTLYQIISK